MNRSQIRLFSCARRGLERRLSPTEKKLQNSIIEFLWLLQIRKMSAPFHNEISSILNRFRNKARLVLDMRKVRITTDHQGRKCETVEEFHRRRTEPFLCERLVIQCSAIHVKEQLASRPRYAISVLQRTIQPHTGFNFVHFCNVEGSLSVLQLRNQTLNCGRKRAGIVAPDTAGATRTRDFTPSGFARV